MYTCTLTKIANLKHSPPLSLHSDSHALHFRIKKVMKRKSNTMKATKYHMCLELGLLIICPIFPMVLLIRSDDMLMLFPISSRKVFWLLTSELMSTESYRMKKERRTSSSEERYNVRGRVSNESNKLPITRDKIYEQNILTALSMLTCAPSSSHRALFSSSRRPSFTSFTLSRPLLLVRCMFGRRYGFINSISTP